MNIRLLTIFFSAIVFFENASSQPDYVRYVNPFIGTGGHGHTFPGALLPFGMVQLSPDTRADDSWDGCSGYHYSDSVIYGFSHTHLSGTGCSDWGDILLMPVTGSVSLENSHYASSFQHKNESASPGYYSVLLDKYQVKAELTSTLRTGVHRYTFPVLSKKNVVLDLLHRDNTLSCGLQMVDSVTVSGFRTSEAWARDQRIYFVIKFSKPIKKIDYAFKKRLRPKLDKSKGERAEGASFEFDLGDSGELTVKVAISPVSEEGALKNLHAEAPHWSFDTYRKAASDTWNTQLSKIEVASTDNDQLTVFYSALYHCFIHPSLNMDVDNRYRGRDQQIRTAEGFVNYSVFSLWDTYRALNPLLLLLEPKRSTDFINTFLAQYKTSGRLPVWELSGNETDCMIGFHSVSVMADAIVKGMKGIDVNLAYEAMKSASNYSAFGIPEFNRQGYLQVDDEHESVSKTLEYGYDNWCIAQLARMLGKSGDLKTFTQRSLAYRNLYDASTGFMRPRKNGNWLSPFHASEINNHFTEGNSWQYSFYVPHDVEGLIRLHGSKGNFEKKLDELFTTSEKTRGRDQADVTGLMGQYAHGNEPSHHMAYLYNYIGQPQKTIERVHKIANEFYKNAPDGLIGNEDCGQMSAWYVFSSMGFYPVCPGSKEYAVGAPIFNNIRMHLESGDTLSIQSHPKSGQVLASVKVNRVKTTNAGISHNQIVSGGNIEFCYTSATDSANRYGQKGFSRAFFKSLSLKHIPALIIDGGSRVFKTNTQVTLQPVNTGTVSVFYTLDGTEPTRSSRTYSGPFTVDSSCVVKARAYSQGDSSVVTQARFYKLLHNYTVTINSNVNPQYTAEGPKSLVDGIYGSTDWRKGDWIGCQGQDFECVVDLGVKKDISYLSLNCLQDTRSWILFPKQVSFYGSADGQVFSLLAQVNTPVKPDDYQIQRYTYEKKLDKKLHVRYVKIVADKFGKLPEWHMGRGGEAFIFSDEVEIR